MGTVSLLGTLPAGAVIGLDSVAFIYFIEEHPLYAPLFEQRIERGENRAVTSVVTLAEVLVQPKRLARDDLVQRYREFLTAGPNVMTVDVTAALAERAATLRAQHGLRLPDAIQVAAALEGGAEYFLTNDARLRRLTELNVVILDDYLHR
ncbi:MAG: type II toxin-antitoxin system VapC family toxin [Candidatus Binatia bacterium]